MYGLYDSGERWMGEPGVDMMGFGFASDATTPDFTKNILGHAIEVRVYRSRGRKRIRPGLEMFKAVVAHTNRGNQPPKSGSTKSQSQNIQGGIK